jgi:N-acetylglucosamine kinase-like BadF-type ATPase
VADPQLVIGVDGGGTRSTAQLVERLDDGSLRTLGTGDSGPSNPRSVGLTAAMTSIDEAIANAFAAAGLERRAVASCCLALSGAGRPEEQEAVTRAATALSLADRIEVTHDADSLLVAGVPELAGIAVIAGTGSMVFGRSEDGRTVRAGGWGWLLGDEGSGFDLVVRTLRKLVEHHDRDADPRSIELFADALGHFGAGTAPELIGEVYRQPFDKARIAGGAALCLRHAGAGDLMAQAIVEEATDNLATTAGVVARRLGFDRGKFPLAIGGGLIRHQVYRKLFLLGLQRAGLEPDPIRTVTDPVVGAVKLAVSRLEAA